MCPISFTIKSVIMESKTRILTVCSSRSGYAQVMTGGAWFQSYGFGLGDQVTLTNPKSGTLVMEVTKPAKEWYREKRTKRLENRARALKVEIPKMFWHKEKDHAITELQDVEFELAQLKQ